MKDMVVYHKASTAHSELAIIFTLILMHL